MKRIVLTVACLSVFNSACIRTASQRNVPYYLSVQTRQDLQTFITYTPERIPLVSAHRGGATTGYPENCIATFDHTLSQTYAIIEFDVQFSKDDSLVIMHDYTLDRTSNGTGRLDKYTFSELRGLRLKDPEGKLTPHTLPTLSEVLQWAKGKTVLTVDVKKGVPAQRIVSAISQHRAQAYAMVITYSIAQMKEYYKLDSTLSFTTTVENFKHLAELLESGVPLNQVAAFVGVQEPDAALYKALHEKGIKCILGTMRLEKGQSPDVYPRLAERGADIFATDRPVEAGAVLKESLPKDIKKRPEYIFLVGKR